EMGSRGAPLGSWSDILPGVEPAWPFSLHGPGFARDAFGGVTWMEPRGVTVWFTGLSGAGKTTIARAVEAALRARGVPVERLDGDVVRQSLTRDLGFSREDREQNIERVAFVAKLLTRHGVICLASFISPYRSMRARARQEIGDFLEVYVTAPLATLMERDVKGLYKKALVGELPNFTGVSDPYEPPEHPDLVLHTDRESLDMCVARVIALLEERGYLPSTQRSAPSSTSYRQGEGRNGAGAASWRSNGELQEGAKGPAVTVVQAPTEPGVREVGS